MSTPSLKSLSKRLDAVEQALARLAEASRPKDWRRVVGLFKDNQFMKRVIAEGRSIRQADRAAAKRENADDRA